MLLQHVRRRARALGARAHVRVRQGRQTVLLTAYSPMSHATQGVSPITGFTKPAGHRWHRKSRKPKSSLHTHLSCSVVIALFCRWHSTSSTEPPWQSSPGRHGRHLAVSSDVESFKPAMQLHSARELAPGASVYSFSEQRTTFGSATAASDGQ